MTVRLLYLVSHPIQYQAPLLRRIAAQPGLALRVLFSRLPAEDGDSFDPGFGREVRWDVPLLEGYDHARLAPECLAEELAGADALWVHGWQDPLFRRAMAMARARGVPVLLRGENWDGAMPDGPWPRSWLKRLYLASVFRRVDAFLAIGSANRDYYLRRGIPASRIHSVPYAVDNAFFSIRAAAARPGRETLRVSLGLDAGRKVVLFAGKLMRRKHPHTLAEAWRTAWPDPRQRPHLLVVGDGEMRGALEAMGEPGLVMAGFRNQSELSAIYDLADVFVLPSEREAWGLAVNEAMACGTAVVVSDQCGCAFDLVDEGCGAVVPAGRADHLATALRTVVERSAEMGAAAARRVAGWDFEADLAGLRAALASVGRAP